MFGKLVRSLSGASEEERAKQQDIYQAEEARRWGVFVEYHHNGGWAQAKAASGGWLSDEAVSYMECEIAARKAMAKRHLDQLEAFNAKFGTTSNAPDAAANGERGADPVPGPAEPKAPHSAGGDSAGIAAHSEADR